MHQSHEILNKTIPRGKILMKKIRIMEIEHLKTERVEFRAS
jgi:hypothetical protein